MNELDIKFLEMYKKFEKILSDMFFCEHGVSEYISVMEAKEKDYPAYCVKVYCWKEDYKNIKHLRWLRNQIVHNVETKGGFCNSDDLIMLNNFYNKIMHQEDALAVLLKLQNAEIKTNNSTNNKNTFNGKDDYKKTKQQTAVAVIIAAVLVLFALIFIFFEIVKISSSTLVSITPLNFIDIPFISNFTFI